MWVIRIKQTVSNLIWLFRDWIQKYHDLNDIIRNKDQEIMQLKEENYESSRKFNILQREFNDLKNRRIETVHTHKISQIIDDSQLISKNFNGDTFSLFSKINSRTNSNFIIWNKTILNSVGSIISSYFEIKDFNKIIKINKEMREFFTKNSEILQIINYKQSEINIQNKESIERLKYQIAKLEAEIKQHQKQLFQRYENSKDEIKEFLIDFMRDDYEPGKRIKDSLDRSWNMLINYTRISEIDDPIEKICSK